MNLRILKESLSQTLTYSRFTVKSGGMKKLIYDYLRYLEHCPEVKAFVGDFFIHNHSRRAFRALFFA